MKFSPQQKAFLAWCQEGEGSCVLEAVAGAGKSTTLIEAARRIDGQVALLAYNNKIAAELKEKLADKDVPHSKARAGTVHSFGFEAYRRAHKNVKVERDKVRMILDSMMPQAHPLTYYRPMIAKLVSLAKQRGSGLPGAASIDDMVGWYDIATHFDVFANEKEAAIPEEQVIRMAIAALKASNAKRDMIDFDDMVYLPVFHRLSFWQYDVVMVDEAQDTNPARRAVVKAMLKSDGRLIAVGDRHQAIYGFTGADNDSLDLIAREFDCIQLPLTTTFRCPKAVVEFSQQWVSHIHAAATAPEGSVSSVTIEQFLTLRSLSDAAVLCRNTKPLVALAFALIRSKVPCRVEGRDIGTNLKKLAGRWKVKSLSALIERLEQHLARELAKYSEKNEAKAQTITDMVETLRVIIDQCLEEGRTSVEDVGRYIDSLFSDDVKGMLVLSTIHKSKGREWERVFWLDRKGTCPSRWAKQEWQKEQEVNLCYVAATRAKSHLIEVLGQVGTDRTKLPKAPAAPTEAVASKRKPDDQRKAEKAARARARRQRRKENVNG